MPNIVTTCVTVARKIRDGIKKAHKSHGEENVLMAQFAALAVRDGIEKKDAFDTLVSIVTGDRDSTKGSEADKDARFAKRRVGMGFRVLKGGSGGKAPHPRHQEILEIWVKGLPKDGYSLDSLHKAVMTTRNSPTIEKRLASLLEEVGFRDALPIFQDVFSTELKELREKDEAEKIVEEAEKEMELETV